MDRAKKSIYGNSCKRERVVRSGAREQLRALDLVYRVWKYMQLLCEYVHAKVKAENV